MSSPAHELSQEGTAVAGEIPSLSTSGSSCQSIVVDVPPRAATAPTVRHRWLFPVMTLAAVAAFFIVVSIAIALTRQTGPSPTQAWVIGWEQACVLGAEAPAGPGELTTGVAHPGMAPGVGRFLAQAEHVTYGALTLADLVLAVGAPERIGCLDYGLLPGPTPVMWLRVLMDDGRLEAYTVLPYYATRLSPDTAVHTLRCYAPDEPYHLKQTIPWQGFASLAVYQACQVGTATPR
jgi:hypothetical protein